MMKWWHFLPQRSTSLLHHNVLEFLSDLDPKVLVWVHPLHFLSLDDNQDKVPPVPLVVHHKLIGFADIELQVIVVAPHDEALLSVLCTPL